MPGQRSGAIFRSAWPTPQIDRLLRAAALPDEAAAADVWRAFEAAADFDHLTAGEMRLIGLAARRLARLAPDSPMRPRIEGIERANWSRSQLAIGEASAGMRALQATGVEMLVMKGAMRTAIGDTGARGRMLNDVDVVVRPDDLARAYEILTDDGWRPAGSGSVVYHASRLAEAVGINLVRGRFGNLDLHRTPFHPPYELAGDDVAIWQRSLPGTVGYASVRAPAPTDAMTISMAHGALDAHKSSDWLADIAACIDRGVDWDLLEEIVARRRLQAAAAISLGYVGDRLEREIPAALLQRLERASYRHPLGLLAAAAETRPKARTVGLAWLLRAVAKQGRLWRTHRRSSARRPVVLSRPVMGRPPAGTAARTLQQALELPGRADGEAWDGSIELTLALDLPPAARRIDFEVNSLTRHHVRLRTLVLGRSGRARLFRFRFPLSLAQGEGAPSLNAVPSRRFNSGAPEEMLARYGATPFEIVRIEARKAAG